MPKKHSSDAREPLPAKSGRGFPVFIVDTREQKPYNFSPEIPIERKKLRAGDYSVKGLEPYLAVERKSLQDFINTVFQHRDRFKVELQKLKLLNYACIIVEASIELIHSPNACYPYTPAQIMGAVTGISIKGNIPVFLAGSRPEARILTQNILMKGYETYAQNIKQK